MREINFKQLYYKYTSFKTEENLSLTYSSSTQQANLREGSSSYLLSSSLLYLFHLVFSPLRLSSTQTTLCFF